MEMNYYLNLALDGEITFFLNAKCKEEHIIKPLSVKEYLLSISSQNKIIKIFKMLGIDLNVLEKGSDGLTILEEKLIQISVQLLKGKMLILNNIEKGLNEKEKVYLKRIIIKLAHNYKVKVLVFTNDADYILNFIDKLIVLNDGELYKIFNKNELYNDEIYKYIDIPDIISFVKKCQNLGKKIDNYTEVSEVLKGLYRL